MKHHQQKRKLGRPTGQRIALLRSLAIALFAKEKIITTEAKAKELRPFAEKLISKAKSDTVASRRLVAERLGQSRPIKKLFEVIAPRFKTRAGGYTRVIKLTPRAGDASPMAIIELV